MQLLKDWARANKYKRIPFKVTRTNHLLVKATVNGIPGRFILDTGASNSCVGLDEVKLFGLSSIESSVLAAGAGGGGMTTQISHSNELKLSRFSLKDVTLVIFDTSHVNAALVEYKVGAVHGILGADILLAGHAIIDYANHCFYLR